MMGVRFRDLVDRCFGTGTLESKTSDPLMRHGRRAVVESLERRELLSVAPGLDPHLRLLSHVNNTAAAVSDDFGNSFSTAASLPLAGNGSATKAGRIDYAGDIDIFRIVAPATGRMTIRQTAATGSSVDSVLSIYNRSQRLLGWNDDSGGTRNSQLSMNVTAGSVYYVKAAGYNSSTGGYSLGITTASSTTTTPAPTPTPTPAPTPTPTPTPSTGAYDIEIASSGFTTSQQAILQQAAQRWEQIIVGDLPNVTSGGRTIDDMRIQLTSQGIDGPGGVLGQAGPNGIRSGGLPYSGTITLDTADVAAMEANGSLLGVLTHEMGHILGIGTMWSSRGLLTGTSTSNPGFTGRQAVAEYNRLFGASASAVPVESGGGTGTRLAHWSENVFGNELLTGWYNTGRTNPISRVTVASLADLGYQVNLAAADAYTPAGTTTSVVSAASSSSSGSVRSGNAYASSQRSMMDVPTSTAQQRRQAVDLLVQHDEWRSV